MVVGTARRRALWVLGTLLVLVVAAAVGAHTPPVRRAVLARAAAFLLSDLDLVLAADSLDYNLLRLRVELRGVELAAATARDVPFLRADAIAVDVPWSVLSGPFALERVDMENARVQIVQRADGSSNLPAGGESAAEGEPAPLHIGRLAIPKLTLEVSNEPSGVSLTVPALSVDVGADEGTVRLLVPAVVRRGDVRTEITELGGGMSFDGRALRLQTFKITSADLALQTDGVLAILAEEAALDLRLSGTTDLGLATRWALEEPRPDGTLAFTASVQGPMAAPLVTMQIKSDSLAQQGLILTGVMADLDLDAQRLRIAHLGADVVNGRVTAKGDLTFETGEAAITATWADLVVADLVRVLAPGAPLRPTGRASGTMSLKGAGSDLGGWEIAVDNRMVAGPLGPSRLPVGGTARLRVGGRTWSLDASQQVAGVPLSVKVGGRLSSEALNASTLAGLVLVPDVPLEPLLTTLAAAKILEAPPAVTGVLRADITLAGTLEAPRFEVEAHAAGVNAGGVADLDADVTAAGTLERLEFDAQVGHAPENLVRATGTVFPQAERVDVRLTGRLADPSRLVDVPLAGQVDLEFEGGGRFDALTGRGSVTVADLVYDAVPFGRLASTIELVPGTARVNASLEEFRATVAAQLGLAAPYETTVDVQVAEADLARLVRGQELPRPLTGLVSLTMHGEGPLEEWRAGTATVDVSRLEAQIGDLAVRLLAAARASYGEGTARVASFEAAIGDTVLSMAGDLPVAEDARSVPDRDALRLSLTGDLAQTLDAVRAAGFSDLPPVSGGGPLALLARVTGSASAPAVSASVDLGPGSIAFADWPAMTAVQLRARLTGGWLELDQAAGEWQGSRFAADGRLPMSMLESYLPPAVLQALPPAPGEASLTARVTSLTPRVLEPFLDAETLAQVEGAVEASLQLTASSLKPEGVRGEIRLDRLDVRVGALPVAQREPTRIIAEGGIARIAAWDWVGEGATLQVQGQVSLEDQQADILTNGRIDLRMLTPFVRDAGLTTAGTLEHRVSIKGPLRDPGVDGQIELSAGEVRLAYPRLVASGLGARAALTLSGGEISSISGSVNGGTLTGSGRLEYGPDRPFSATLTAVIQEMALNFPDGFRTELGADVSISLAENRETGLTGGAVSGTVTVLRGSYREPLAVATGLLTRLRTERLAAAAVQAEESLVDRLVLNVRLVTEEDLLVDNNYGRMELGADLRVIGTAALPSLSGRAMLREGGQLFLGRNIYTVESGTVDFTNPVTIEPNMNIVARTRAGGEEIELAINGTPANLTVEPRSTTSPELGVADVWSLLLTGRRLDEVTGDEAQIVGEQVLGYLSGDVLGLASRAVGVDTIRLGGIDETELRRDPTLLATETDPSARLTFGKSIGDKVDLTFSQNLRDGKAQIWIVDYLPTRQIALRLVSDDNDLRSYQFRHDVSFGDTRPRRAPVDARRDRRVTAVRVSGSLVFPEERVQGVLGLTSGDRFDFADWQRDRDRLEELYRREGYREARISANREETPDGVDLAYEIEAGSRTAIEVSGYQVPRPALEALAQAWNESVFDGFLIEDARAIVQSALAEDGYLRAEIMVTISSEATKLLSISIVPGERTSDFRVRLEGADEATTADLDEWMRAQGLDETAWRDAAALESALTNRLRTAGHLGAQVRVGSPRFEGAVATLPVEVEAGPVYTVSDVSLDGARTLYDATLNAIAIEPGVPYDSSVLDAARGRVSGVYRRAGFSQASVAARAMVDAEAGQVALVFEITEGPRQIVRDVLVEGNSAIDSDVITRALRIRTGIPVEADTWLAARTRVFETGLFRRVDLQVEPIEDAQADADTQPMRIHVTVQEWPRLRLRYGFVVEEQYPDAELEGRELVPGLSADLTRRTLFGRAIAVGAAAEYQRREQRGRGFLNAATLFGLPIESTISTERSREDFADATLVTERTGVSWEQRFRFARYLRLSYSYRYERNRTFDSQPSGTIFDPFDIQVNIARLTGTSAYDTRDSPLDASRGWFLASSVDWAPDAGSDIQFVKYVGQAYRFQPWRGTVLASAARLGLARPLGGQVLIPSERFFAGGARTVRGADEDRLGPIDFFGDPVGGQALFVLNQEVRFPIFGWFRGVAFVDAGNVFPRVSDLRLGGLEGSWGAGLRLATPFALLRADYGRLWSPGPENRSGRWTIGLGQSF